MSQRTLEGHYDRSVDLDMCHVCSAFWFDGLETLQLAPSGILDLFVVINDHRNAQRNPLGTMMACPHCRQRLVLTHDQQRNTRFSYWRCPEGHGRFITFFEFLREKNFVRPLSPTEIATLKATVRTVTCSSCGAPVSLETGAVCPYCRAPLSMLDPTQMEIVAAELTRQAARRQTVDPTLPEGLLRDRTAVEASLRRIGAGPLGLELSESSGIVEAGLAAVVAFFKHRD
jgi:uncharacterized protein YbaR (Trm112 family)